MKSKILVLVAFVLLLGALSPAVSAEKTWNFNNYTVNISDDLHVNGVIYGDGLDRYNGGCRV